MRLFAISMMCFFSMTVGAAESLVELNIEGESKQEQEPAARAQITHDVLERAAQRSILELLGEKKYNANHSAVQELVRESNKFIPFVKAGPLEHGADGFKMAVNMKVSVADLKELLAKNGLLYEAESAAVALPLLTLNDSIHGIRYTWWAEAPDSSRVQLASVEKKLENSLRDEFMKRGFFVLKPATAGLYEMVPGTLRQFSLRPEDLGSLAEFFHAQMALIGEVTIENSTRSSSGLRVTAKISAQHAQTGRFVAEVARTSELEAGNLATHKKLPQIFDDLSRDLAAQVLEAWRRGSFGAELLKLTVNGQLSPQQIEGFKSGLIKSIPQVRSIRERLFEPGKITFEVDVSGSATDLANRLKGVEPAGLHLQVGEVTVDHVSVSVRPTKAHL